MFKKSLLVLALGTFALGIAQFSMMAILSSVARDLNLSIPRAGDFISAYSLGIAMGAPSLVVLSRYPMKQVLLLLRAVMAAGNIFAAIASGYDSFLAARFISGLPHGAYFGVAAIMAANLASPGQKASYVTVMISGMTVANLAGVPLVTWLSRIITWRAAFFIASGAAVLAFVGIWLLIPHTDASRASRGSFKSQFEFLKHPAPWLILAGAFFGQAAILSWYSYMEPILLGVTHMPAQYITFVMLIAGVGMVLGGLASGKLADRSTPGLVSAMICILMLPTLFLAYACSQYRIVYLCVVFFGAAEIFAILGPAQYLIVRFAPGGEMAGGACVQVALNISGALAAWLGGCAIKAGLGATSPALLGIPFAIIGAAAMFYFNHCYKDQK